MNETTSTTITPTPELIEQWMQSHSTKYDLARQAARWGAAAALRAAADQLREAYANEEYVDSADDWLDDIAAELEAAR
jgi:hypothetical protein